MNATRSLLLLALGFARPLAAEDLPPPPANDVATSFSYTVECQWVVVSARVIPDLVPELSDETKVVAAWARVQAMMERGEAKLGSSLFGTGGAGKLRAESTAELPYVTDVAPPELPNGPAAKKPASPAGVAEEVRWVPTHFDRATVGPQLELEMRRLPNSKVLLCSYFVHQTQLEKILPTEIGRLPGGRPIMMDEPLFTTTREYSSTYLESGKPKLLGVHRVPGPEARFEFVVLTTRLHDRPTR